MSEHPSPRPSDLLRRNAALIVTIILTVTMVGFISGIREPAAIERADDAPSPQAREQHVPTAVRYADLPRGGIRPDSARCALKELAWRPPSPFDPVIRTDEMKMAALEDRARWRAFDGAPPAVPHPIDYMQTNNCMACHASGIRVGEKLATRVSHPHMTNCTQCHVESIRPEMARYWTRHGENDFIGIARSGPGERAGPGAPPTIPHTTWMRQDCRSCHGLVARPGLRTTHPWLTNCTQCHAPSAALDQVEFPFPSNEF